MTLLRLAASAAALATLAGCAIVEQRAERRETAALAAYPPQGQFVDVAGRRVHAVVQGSGPDVVLLHGAGGSARDMTFRLAPALTERYRVISFDRPGLGYTDRVSRDYVGPFNTAAETPAEQARLLHAAAVELGVSNPIVLGHSYGGAVALAWGLDHDPAALVIVSGTSNPWPGGDLGPLYNVTSSALGGAAVVPLLTAFAGADRQNAVLRRVFAPQAVPEDYARYFGVPMSLRRDVLRANARQVNSLYPALVEMTERYGELEMPVEVLHGTADKIVPLDVHAEPLSRQAPAARLTRLDGLGHMPHQVATETVAGAVDRAASRAGLR